MVILDDAPLNVSHLPLQKESQAAAQEAGESRFPTVTVHTGIAQNIHVNEQNTHTVP